MGGTSSSPWVKSRSLADLDHLKPTAEQRAPKTRSRLASMAHSSSKHLSRLPFNFKRKSGSRDKVKSFQDLISTLSVHDVEALYKELETSRILSVLQSEADSARPTVLSIGEQLYSSTNKDFILEIDGVSYPVHRRLLISRCDSVRDLVVDNTTTPKLMISFPYAKHFSHQEVCSFIRYLYTDQWDGDGVEVLEFFREWFGCRRSLLVDLKKAKDNSLQDGDLTIALTSAVPLNDVSIKSHLPDYKIRCDSAIVSARSVVFQRLLKHFGNKNQIVLDEALLPRGFAPVVMHFLYTDELDFSMICDTSISQSSLSEARAIVAGRSPHSPLHRAIQLIHIAKFFSLNKLVQLCEDVIVSSLCQESCVSILSWASDGGSQYVAQCAQSYLESEFSQIASSHCLFDVSLESLVKCAQSQFTQATEVEILEAVIRWGEHELLRRMEEREPNVVADTTHSISRRGIKRGDLSGTELRAILAPITSHLRIDYVLPPFHQSLNAAYCRGILDRAPLRSDLVCPSTSEINPDIHWFRPEQDAPGPRYYIPYYKITKEQLRSFGERCESYVAYTPLTTNCTVEVVFANLWPDLLCEEKFCEIRTKIITAIENADRQYHIRLFPRLFHRRMAIQLIALRVLRTLEVDPDCVRVCLLSDSQNELTTPEDEEYDDPSVLARRGQHWPDIMTVKRMEVVAQSYE
ncbi:hypothetical protein KIN20_003468 [Parelaphostrongylus tenuis]|uniref:BTB domain-containing protein n=1 Tax=Parelaphostrongylus tenuis TaxID=148309 RepID=A0AAD5M1H7_PARTN|nr:hypothetical protein KIN20_003468 [Parelaphostrongylus tenuis]